MFKFFSSLGRNSSGRTTSSHVRMESSTSSDMRRNARKMSVIMDSIGRAEDRA